jgi:hypothetical protein
MPKTIGPKTRNEMLTLLPDVESRELAVQWTGHDSTFYVIRPTYTEIIIVERRPTAPAMWSMVFMWQMADKWVVSADVQNSPPDKVFESMERRIRE